VDVTFDPAKRAKALQERGLDFADAMEVFAGRHTVELDERRDSARRGSPYHLDEACA
jgi:uncharacterized DUF497 family protein